MKRKGISLIVLIITIVVIIILAAAIILNLSNTNLIENANEAVVKQDIKAFQDELTMYIADQYADTLGKFRAEDLNATVEDIIAIIPSIKSTDYKGYLKIENGKLAVLDTMPEPQKTWAMEALGLKESSTEPETPVEPEDEIIALDNTTGTKNESITGEKFAYNNPVIPVGFKAVNTAKASWKDSNNDRIVDGWNDGLVLMDSEENEYVWIPVDGINVTYSKWNGSVNSDKTVTKDQVKDDTLPSGIESEREQITKYGGFYVARYEAGLPDSQTTEELMLTKIFSPAENNRTDIGKAQSKLNKIAWSNIDYNNAKIVSENVISTNYVQSGLVTGTQWDTMLTFLSQEVNVDTDCTSWGNYQNKIGYTINGYYKLVYKDAVYNKGEYTKTNSGNIVLATGMFGNSVEEGSPKNLYDVAGNMWEWSTEIITEQGGEKTVVGNNVLRSGSFTGNMNNQANYVASYRLGDIPGQKVYPHIGFRFVLYVK